MVTCPKLISKCLKNLFYNHNIEIIIHTKMMKFDVKIINFPLLHFALAIGIGIKKQSKQKVQASSSTTVC